MPHTRKALITYVKALHILIRLKLVNSFIRLFAECALLNIMSDLALPGPICDDKCREPQHIWGKWGAAKPVKISLSLNHSSFFK